MSRPTPYRFSRETDAFAPKPGHHLATITYQHRGESSILWMIEGPENDALSFRAMSSTFEQTVGSRFRIAGDAIENLSELPYSPHWRELNFSFEVDSGPFPTRAQSIFSTVRAPNKIDPDSALTRFTWPSGEQIDASITELRRAWAPTLVICGAALAIGTMLAGRRLAGLRSLRASIVEESFTVGGDFAVAGSVCGKSAPMDSLQAAPTQAAPIQAATAHVAQIERAHTERPVLPLAASATEPARA